ncbi:hypothetical protein JAAARDRAFT_74302 [Jaapia argillacea MUCL 33604]|uniref:AB hydrolase-1 domain-containing protein n=1 Tax=Jaapia argillacea MUCL 33604 TaxID=933084 RepID=A0A067P5P1_9AGAM|nr:hypothetical protein JAAARDRAFT_74302 [Jaapia argillacea MUCL 33604]
MIGNSTSEYFFIRTCITSLRLVAPVSLLYLPLSWYHGSWLVSKWLGIWCASEVVFYLGVYLPRKAILQEAAQHPPRLSRPEREALFNRCALHLRQASHTTGCFFSPPSSTDIKRDNAIEWLHWALFNHRPGKTPLRKRPAILSSTADEATRLLEGNGFAEAGKGVDGVDEEDWEEEIEGYLKIMGDSIGHPLEPGRNDKVQSMTLTFDPVLMLHRPLVWYSIIALTDTITSAHLISLGFKHYTPHNTLLKVFPPRPLTAFSRTSVSNDLSYWYRPHRSKTKLPILFIHGIGIGLWPYVHFIQELINQDPEVGILALEILPISSRITNPPLARQAFLSELRKILDSISFSSPSSSSTTSQQYLLISHSYGTFLTSHILHSPLSSRFPCIILVDPIPFLLHHPSVAYNFVYRVPKTGPQWQLWYFASRDPDVARAISRWFFWSEGSLWREDLGIGEDVGEGSSRENVVAGGEGIGGGNTGVGENGDERVDGLVDVGKGKEKRRCLVVLSGSDQIVDSQEVFPYLTLGQPALCERSSENEERLRWRDEKGRLEVVLCEGLDHAMVFDSLGRRSVLLEGVKGLQDGMSVRSA